MKTLNLRHAQSLTPSDVSSLTKDVDIHSIWMGPHFGVRNDRTDDTEALMEFMHSLPKRLVQLDLDLTLIGNPNSDAIHQSMEDIGDQNEETIIHESSVLMMKNVMSVLLGRLNHLQSLSLRHQGPQAVFGLSRALPLGSSLQVLDFRENHMGTTGVQVLVQSLLTEGDHCPNKRGVGSLTLPQLRHLILSWNSLTDEAVEALTPILNHVRYLDLSCNPALTNKSLNQYLAGALATEQCSLEQLFLFSCRGITRLSPDLVDIVCNVNVRLRRFDLQGTGIKNLQQRYEWEQIQFALKLNACARETILRPHRSEDERNDSQYDDDIRDNNLWWSTSSDYGHEAKKTKINNPNNLHKNEDLIDLWERCNNQGDDYFSITYYFCRETVHRWCRSDEC